MKREYTHIYQGVIFNVRDVAYLLGNLNERFLQKQKRDKERKKEKKKLMYKRIYLTSCRTSTNCQREE